MLVFLTYMYHNARFRECKKQITFGMTYKPMTSLQMKAILLPGNATAVNNEAMVWAATHFTVYSLCLFCLT